MFDLVARQAPRGRRPLAALLSLLLNGGSIGFLAWLTASADAVVDDVKKVVMAVPVDYRPVDLLPPAGSPDAPKAHADRARPRVSPTTPSPLTPTLPDPILHLEPTQPPPDGGDSGDDGGNGGDNGGDGGENGGSGGENGGQNGGENGGGGDLYRSVHWTDVRPTHRVTPRFPEEARALGFTTASCVVRISIDGEGVPESVTPTHCPDAFARSAVRAAYEWRFTPLPEGQRAQFELRIEYRLR